MPWHVADSLLSFTRTNVTVKASQTTNTLHCDTLWNLN
jgi:hypothetical protein